MTPHLHQKVFARCTGSALIICLIFLLLLTIIGVASMQSATLQERMAGNTRDRNVAFQSAEAAIRAGEDTLGGAVVPSFNNSVAGYRQPVANSGSASYWETYNWTAGPGTNSGAQEYALSLSGVAAKPRFVIEELPVVASPGKSVKLGAVEESGFYRITVRAVGTTPDTAVILQSVFKR